MGKCANGGMAACASSTGAPPHARAQPVLSAEIEASETGVEIEAFEADKTLREQTETRRS